MHGPDEVPPVDDWNRLLEGRVAVVTGAASGIGAAIAELFAQHGATVQVADVDGTGAHRVVERIREAGGAADAVVVDVTTEEGVAALAEQVLERHRSIEVLVNDVGDYRPLVPFGRSGPDSWEAMYRQNLWHVLAVTRALLPTMIDAGRGAIVNVHSVEAMRGYPGDPVYGAMKAAVAAFTTDLAVHVGRHGIRVNGIGPDLTQTPQVDVLGDGGDGGAQDHADPWTSWAPVGRPGWPLDQARMALVLASDLSSFVTGHNVPVDGGSLAGGGWFWSPTARRFVNRPGGL